MAQETTGNYTVVLMPEEDGGFSVICPALPGCVTQGETAEEALANIAGSIRGWVAQEGPFADDDPLFVADEIHDLLYDRARVDLPLAIESRVIAVELPVFSRAQRRRLQRQQEKGVLPFYVPPHPARADGSVIKLGALMALIRQSGGTVEEYLQTLQEQGLLPEGLDLEELRQP